MRFQARISPSASPHPGQSLHFVRETEQLVVSQAQALQVAQAAQASGRVLQPPTCKGERASPGAAPQHAKQLPFRHLRTVLRPDHVAVETAEL